ncbi:hypothetical protein KCTCHS21_01300 [Cohnella abietis]|uniref:Uncharacterized protein n=1 Tax=Cohnella abietis TaxID=2507935 RepID=A0A3T1CY52_9BACL|nr:hypothetical protein KCTCHS21_01300 [Cohnella abietis]
MAILRDVSLVNGIMSLVDRQKCNSVDGIHRGVKMAVNEPP